MSWREQIGVEELKRERPPRGAIVIVAIGLVACLVAVLASTGKGEGEAAHLEFVKTAQIPDSKPVPVPGGTQKMQLVAGLIRSTGTNVSGYNLFQVATVLQIESGAPVGNSRILCSITAPPGAEIGQTSGGLRALYPRSSEGGIFNQEVPETVLINFSSHGSELAVLEVGDLPRQFTSERGVKAEWPEFEEGTEHLKYFIAGGKPKKDLRLPFNSIWRSTAVPAAAVACTLTTSAGKATVETKGALKNLPPPIDEEKEEEEQERREEEESPKERETKEAGGEGE
jgi:hypothetical protein